MLCVDCKKTLPKYREYPSGKGRCLPCQRKVARLAETNAKVLNQWSKELEEPENAVLARLEK